MNLNSRSKLLFFKVMGSLSLIFMLGTMNELNAQVLFKEDFESLAKERLTAGVKGLSLNLGEEASDRTPIENEIDKKVFSESFSLFFWVKAASDGFDYDIITLDFPNKDSINTRWSIGKQANGAWAWESSDGKGKVAYQYRPTASRQNIANQEWNMIGISYDAQRGDIWFYYNGENVAIYHIGSKQPLVKNGLLSIGGKPKGGLGEWDTFNGSIDELEIHGTFLFQAQMKNHYREFFPTNNTPSVENVSKLKVMSFNIWHGGKETGKYVGPQRIANLIRDNGIDIVALQETYGSGEQIADALGYYFYLRSTNLSILSRFPIEETLLAHHPFYSGAVRIGYQKDKQIAFATNWLNYPIDYWDLLENNKTIDSLDWYNKQVSGNKGTLAKILETLRPSLDRTDSIPLIFCGDFNSGSHLDWIEETKHLNNGYIMPFPSSQLMMAEGFKDSYREVFPNPVQDRGITWSATFTNAFKDRIDYIYYKGKKIKVKDAGIVDSRSYKFPSDHAAVMASFEMH